MNKTLTVVVISSGGSKMVACVQTAATWLPSNDLVAAFNPTEEGMGFV